ncbi:S41 family peptidase [Ectothiorhodospira variabilis]|uniref:S41 family peptidase n=1 Tax=Ectothiorhodospira variabilis TaxID=505694 RepID=UPI001EFB2B79|nr:S41 family peptidase [Ectothiorhodospira variabilis]MCG5495597.1 S41 family peptidase [Ectothiorhodospira variabilis]MCG5503065.1 S41 family peptidase [Ectothiorhodospira variabilis]MCG5506176.1 S41 family peptidase [Ectothiorhodospira variabilis]
MRRVALALLVLGLIVPGPALTEAAAPLDEIRQLLRQHLYEAPPESVLAGLRAGHLNADLASVDPYARHFPDREAARLDRDAPTWTGIGADLQLESGQVWLQTYQGGPAKRAGLPDRARLLEIDGQSLTDWQADALMNALRGEAGSRVELTWQESAAGPKRRTVLTREPFRPLDVELVEPWDRGVVRVRDFLAGRTRPALMATWDFLDRVSPEASDAGTPLVMDLRHAGGGDLHEALDLAGLFLPPGASLGGVMARGGEIRSFRAPEGTKLSMPLVLLVGPHTASAAEVFAGILQHHGRARLVGQPTFGKCSSQTDRRLSDGSVLRFTNREVLLPDGQSCSGRGLRPDVEVGDVVLSDLQRLMSLAMALEAGRGSDVTGTGPGRQ